MKYIKFLFKHKIDAVVVFLMNTITKILAILTPVFIGKFLDMIISGENTQNVTFWVTILTLISLIGIIINYKLSILSVELIAKVSNDIYLNALNHLARVNIREQIKYTNNWMNQRIIEDSNTVTRYIVDKLYNLISNVILFTIVLLMCLSINGKMGLLLLISFPVYVLVYLHNKKDLFKSSYSLKESSNVYFSKTQEYLEGLKTQKMHILYDEFSNMVCTAFNKHLTYINKQANVSARFVNINNMIVMFTTLAMIFISLNDILNGKMSIGQFTIVNAYFSMLFGYINFFISLLESYQISLVSQSRLNEIFMHKADIYGYIELDQVNRIEVKEMSFYFDDGLRLIDKLNCSFDVGNIYCIVGNNGTGKSTLLDLICGIYINDNSGEILVNNYDIETINIEKIRRDCISVCEQSPFFFTSNIREYITCGLKVIEEHELNLLCDSFKLSELINVRESENVDTKKISGGEFKKICIVKALLKPSSVLILDEPTVSLDISSINALKIYLSSIKKSKIVIIVSHDQNIIDIADKVININDKVTI